MAGKKFDDDEEMKWAVLTEFGRMTKEGAKEGDPALGHVFDAWEKRLTKAIAVGGDYIEK